MKCKVIGPHTIQLRNGYCVLRARMDCFLTFRSSTNEQRTAHVFGAYPTHEQAIKACVDDAAQQKAAA